MVNLISAVTPNVSWLSYTCRLFGAGHLNGFAELFALAVWRVSDVDRPFKWLLFKVLNFRSCPIRAS